MTHATPAVKPFAIFLWLTVITVVELGFTGLGLSKPMLASALIGSSLVKAALVAMYFMHLKFEKKLIWGILIFFMAVGAIFVLGLFPDIVIGHWERA